MYVRLAFFLNVPNGPILSSHYLKVLPYLTTHKQPWMHDLLHFKNSKCTLKSTWNANTSRCRNLKCRARKQILSQEKPFFGQKMWIICTTVLPTLFKWLENWNSTFDSNDGLMVRLPKGEQVRVCSMFEKLIFQSVRWVI